MIIIFLYQLFVLLLHSVAVLIFDKDNVKGRKITTAKNRNTTLPPLAAAQESR